MRSNAPFSLDELMAALSSPDCGSDAPHLTEWTMTDSHRDALRRLFGGVVANVGAGANAGDSSPEDEDLRGGDTSRELFEGLLTSGAVDLDGVDRDFLDTFRPDGIWARVIDSNPGGLPDNSDSSETKIICDGTVCLRLSFNCPAYCDDESDASLFASVFDAKYAAAVFAREIGSSYGPLLSAIDNLTNSISADAGCSTDDSVMKMRVFEGLLSLAPGLARPYERKLAYIAASGGASDATPDASAAPRRRKPGRL